jgi:hypothetical protein
MESPMKKFTAFCVLAIGAVSQAQGVYVVPHYGISFKYPEGYRVLKGERPSDDEDLGYLGPIPLEFVAPGGVRLATVEAANDSYPGTDFVNSFVTIDVNQYLTREECGTLPEGSQETGMTSTRRIGGIRFDGAEIFDASMNHQFSGTEYHAYVNGFCYEIGTGVATGGLGVVEGMRPYPKAKVSAILDGILRSIRLHPQSQTSTNYVPSIRSFELIPIDRKRNRYRIAWHVDGAQPGDIFLTASCVCTITAVPGIGAIPRSLQKDMLNSVSAKTGSFDVDLENAPGPDDRLTLRLFVAGHPAVAKVLTLTVPPLPFRLDGAGPQKRAAKSHSGNEPYNPIKCP